MITKENLREMVECLDCYMLAMGKREIDEMEANRELEQAGLMSDDKEHPGRPLREALDSLRDNDMLPQNVSKCRGLWIVHLSATMATWQIIVQFGY
ncbi:MAG: hypothetical protein IJB46_09775 [Prevotella sp.]|nr:hypothetical protein [Prevotella sp.]